MLTSQFRSSFFIGFFRPFVYFTDLFDLSTSYLNLVGFGLYTTEIVPQTSPYFARLCYLLYVKSIARWQKLLFNNSIGFFQTAVHFTYLFAL